MNHVLLYESAAWAILAKGPSQIVNSLELSTVVLQIDTNHQIL